MLSEPKGWGGVREEDLLVFPLFSPLTPSPAEDIVHQGAMGLGDHKVPGADGVCQETQNQQEVSLLLA